MVIVAGTFRIDRDQRSVMMESISDLVKATRAEAGCLEYVFSVDPDDPELVRLFEVWQDQESLDAHLESAHLLKWREEEYSQLAVSNKDILKYQISEFESLP